MPSSVQDLFSPLSSLEEMIPERAQAYLGLLAESTSTPGAMQKVRRFSSSMSYDLHGMSDGQICLQDGYMDMPIEYMTAQTAWKKGFIFQTLDTDHSFYFLVAPCSADG